MLLLKGQKGTYKLSASDSTKGKFGGILRGERVEDRLAVSAKKLSNSSTDTLLRQKIDQLNHPGLTPTLETIHHQGDTYLIRHFVEGTCFKTILKKHAIHKHLEPSFYAQATINLLRTLEYIHSQGIIHRDIKPSNIIVPHGPKQHPRTWSPAEVVLIDLEQACAFPSHEHARSPFALVYSPPEQLLNHQELVCPASDLFALAVTLFELLAGSAPWVDCNAELLLHLQLTYPMKQRPGIDQPLFEILAKAAYKEPFKLPPRRLANDVIVEILKKGIAMRYQSANEMRVALEDYLVANPSMAKRSLWDKWFG